MAFAPVATLIRLVVVGLNDNWPRPRTINSPRLRLGLLIVLRRGQLSLLIALPVMRLIHLFATQIGQLTIYYPGTY